MRMLQGKHLTYCLNVHPGEAWSDQIRAIRENTLDVRRRVCDGLPFGLGLRMGADAARELASAPRHIASFKAFLDREGLYVFTVNAFPFGRFHGSRVKDDVYVPDWTRRERLKYTCRVADILAALVPEDTYGSISTAPLTFKGWREWAGRIPHAVQTLVHAAAHLYELRQRTGREIVLAVEPEPGCYPETAEEMVEVVGMLRERGVSVLRRTLGYSQKTAEEAVTRHIGCCLDTAHMAVCFESIPSVLALFRKEGIRIAKVQLSAAIEAACLPAAFTELKRFNDDIYLHQVVHRAEDGELSAWLDLPEFLAQRDKPCGGCVRVHYHVPLFIDTFGSLRTTAALLASTGILDALCEATSHLEVETYTWQVWKEATSDASHIVEGLARELTWVTQKLSR